MIPRHLLGTFAVVAACGTALAAPISGRVVQVIDGDTIIVRFAGGAEHRVRIAGADAPERGQTHSAQAKRRAESLMLGRSVAVDPIRGARDGSTIARVRVNGRDAAERLVGEGSAWHAPDRRQTPSERRRHEEAQREAQERRAGLWEGERPEEPRLLRERREGRRAQP